MKKTIHVDCTTHVESTVLKQSMSFIQYSNQGGLGSLPISPPSFLAKFPCQGKLPRAPSRQCHYLVRFEGSELYVVTLD